MKKLLCLVWLMLLLVGCGAEETYETLGDVYGEPVSAQALEIALDVPQNAVTQVMEGEGSGTLYFADDYTICLQVMDGGDLNSTLLACTGFEKSRLNMVETKTDGYKRYEAVWSCAGENGDQVGRIAVLDDGNYHYTVTVLADAEAAGELSGDWQAMFRSFRLTEPGTQVNSGS